jgi:hypothetical protein
MLSRVTSFSRGEALVRLPFTEGPSSLLTFGSDSYELRLDRLLLEFGSAKRTGKFRPASNVRPDST